MNDINVFIAFGGGLASFFSPCVLPMVPVYLASLAGPEFLDRSSISLATRYRVFFHSIAFVLGFSFIFTVLGIIAGLSGQFISPNAQLVRYIIGPILIIFGLYMLLSARWPKFAIEKHLKIRAGSSGYLRSFLTGAVFTFAWTPCVSPILASIWMLSLSGESVFQSTGLLLIFALGMGIPFLTIGFAIGSGLKFLRVMRSKTIWLYILGGVSLILVGLLILLGKLNILAL